MTTYFNAFVGKARISRSDYAPLLETIAPGICALVDPIQSGDEYWFDVLERLLPFILMTQEQCDLLLQQIAKARAGTPAPLVFDPTTNLAAAATQVSNALAANSAEKPTLTKVISYISAGLTVVGWLK